MRIAVAGSTSFSRDMIRLKKELEERGHSVILPKFTEEYARMGSPEEMHMKAAENKAKNDLNLIKGYFEEIRQCDALLVFNRTRNRIENYIGGNAFLEMGFAYVFGKRIFLFGDIPEMIYSDEIRAMCPIVLNGDLEKLV